MNPEREFAHRVPSRIRPRVALAASTVGILAVPFIVNCTADMAPPDVDEASLALLGECTTTGQCKQMYGPEATDCWNGGGGVCLCGDIECSSIGDDPPGPGGTSIPAKIEAEDFDRFNELSSANFGNCGSGPVDQQATSDAGGGCNVGWTEAGEWLEYDIDSGGGSFDIDLRLASDRTNRDIRVELDGAPLGVVRSPANGWQTWGTVDLTGVNISAGSHTLRVVFVNGLANLNWIDVKASAPPSGGGDCVVSGPLRQWHRVALTCEGPSAGENSDDTFTDYRMEVTFSKGGTSIRVPGHFAADGQAAQSGATSGDRWRAYFMPPETGTWNYEVSFRSGPDIAVSSAANAG
ncbi:MAG: carbohydrate-binding domain-containing protein, partial [Myxococcota bacterium]